MKIILRHIFILLGMVLLGSCRSDFDFEKHMLSEYDISFRNTYGITDERQDWLTAAIFSITAKVEMKSENLNIVVYSGNPNSDASVYKLASYKRQGQEISFDFDGPYTLSEVYVGVEAGARCALKRVPVSTEKSDVTFSSSDFIEGSLPDAQGMSYIFAYEVGDSLGFFDFNDIILEVRHVSGESYADVMLRAVGVEQPVEISFGSKSDKIVMFEDAHKAFGYHSADRIINVTTFSHNNRTPIQYNDLPVGEDFSIVNSAGDFVITTKSPKGKVEPFFIEDKSWEYTHFSTKALLIANPQWDWVSEGVDLSEANQQFVYWMRSYHKYNSWWDNLWYDHDLMQMEDGSFQPNYNYKDILFSPSDIASVGLSSLVIGYERLSTYINAEEGVNISFVVQNRCGKSLCFSLHRADDGFFELYDNDASIYVLGDQNIDFKGKSAESCHLLLTNKTLRNIIENKTSIKISFEPEDNSIILNSVWIRER